MLRSTVFTISFKKEFIDKITLVFISHGIYSRTLFYCKYDFPTNTERLPLVYGYLLLPEFYHYCGATRRKISRDAFPRDSCRSLCNRFAQRTKPFVSFWGRRFISSLYGLLIPISPHRPLIFWQPIKYHVVKRSRVSRENIHCTMLKTLKRLYLIFQDLVLKKQVNIYFSSF